MEIFILTTHDQRRQSAPIFPKDQQVRPRRDPSVKPTVICSTFFTSKSHVSLPYLDKAAICGHHFSKVARTSVPPDVRQP